MNSKEFQHVVRHLRQVGVDTQTCEVKESADKLPSSLAETLSAFANSSRGGTIILGLSEKNGFLPVEKFSTARMQDALVSVGEKLTPVVRPEIEIFPVDGTNVLAARVLPLPGEDKPCYITERGVYGGSYIRTRDGNRRLTRYEADRLIEASHQPRWDSGLIAEASLNDLEERLVQRVVERQKLLHPRIFGHLSETEVLSNLRIIAEDNGTVRPTLAGLLALGHYPQKYFPTLVATFTLYPDSNGDGNPDSHDYRFIDSQTLVGALPYIIADAVELVRKHMNTGAVIEGAFRKDLPDYPLIAVREAVANALQHRDYSSEGRASAVSINMYPDRLEILNPAGLYGRVTLEDIGKPGLTASRNQFLSAILETTPYPGEGFVVENRGSGIRTIKNSLEKAKMFPAEISSTLTNFKITFLKRRRGISERKSFAGPRLEQAILNELKSHASLTLKDIIAFSGCSRSTVANKVRKLVAEGKIEPLEPPKSPKQRYRKVR